MFFFFFNHGRNRVGAVCAVGCKCEGRGQSKGWGGGIYPPGWRVSRLMQLQSLPSRLITSLFSLPHHVLDTGWLCRHKSNTSSPFSFLLPSDGRLLPIFAAVVVVGFAQDILYTPASLFLSIHSSTLTHTHTHTHTR